MFRTWEKQKADLHAIKEIKRQLEDARNQLDVCQRQGNFEKASQLRYELIPKLEKKLPQTDEEDEEIKPDSEKLVNDYVTANDIAMVVSKVTGIPVTSLIKSEREKLLHLEEDLGSKVIGQNEAIEAISDAVRRSRSGISNPSRPIASFMFLGPTGVGKTELCKQLASSLFSSESALIRIDMSEYMEKFAVSRLIGAPPGYVGHEAGGELTNAVKRKPYSVILFDEFEKAHRDVHSLLLQVLDEGALTDSQGHKVDFKNTIIIMTSNIGAEHFVNSIDVDRPQIMDELKSHCSPEFLNRIDEVILFNRLCKESLRRIVKLRLTQVQERLDENSIKLEMDQACEDFLCEKGYDFAYGARPLQRAIQRFVLNPLARKIIDGTVKNRSVVCGRVQGDALEFSSKE